MRSATLPAPRRRHEVDDAGCPCVGAPEDSCVCVCVTMAARSSDWRATTFLGACIAAAAATDPGRPSGGIVALWESGSMP